MMGRTVGGVMMLRASCRNLVGRRCIEVEPEPGPPLPGPCGACDTGMTRTANSSEARTPGLTD